MAVVPTVTFGGTNVNTFGVFIQADTDGWLDAPEVRVETSELVGGIGGVIAATDTVGIRRLVLPVSVSGTTVAALRGYEATLKAYLRKDVTVKIDDGTNAYEIDGRLHGITLRPYKIPLSPRTDGKLSFLCADPLWRATSNTTEALSGTPNSLALGSGPVRSWVLTVTATSNSITDITVTLGTHTLTYTGTIASGQALVVDSSDFTVENNGSDALANWTGGFPYLDPRYSPSVSAVKASGSGTLGGSLIYKRRYF